MSNEAFIKEFGTALLEELFENIYGGAKSPNIKIFNRVKVNDLNEKGDAEIELAPGIIMLSWEDGDRNGSEIVEYSFTRYEPKSENRIKIKNAEEVFKILSKISFASSCMDLGWGWEVTPLGDVGFLMRTSFNRPDSYRPRLVDRGYGRWMFCAWDTPTSGIVKTAWLCVELVVRHELMEGFLYRKARIFNPHKSLTDLARPELFEESET